MGTRNLIAVFFDGEYRVAQYSQWDGYPEGQGATCLNFCQKLSDGGFRREFEQKLKACSWATSEYIDAINERIKSGELDDYTRVYPELSRDTGADILELVYKSENGLKLRNRINFAANSLFCEYVWVIDLDKNTFEGYEGFNAEALTENERFYFLSDKAEDGYMPVKLVAEWQLDNLPTLDEMCAAFNNGD